ncbi:N-acetyltransferase family protein [Pseudolysinimonas sp.]
MTVVVRPAAPGDEAAWRGLFRDYGTFYETSFDDAHLDHVWARLLDPGQGVHALVAEVDGRVVGMAHYRQHPDTFSRGDDWYLDDLFTAPDARGAGVGTALLAHLTELARATGPGTLRWITAADNATAQRVYDRVATKTTWVTYEVRV